MSGVAVQRRVEDQGPCISHSDVKRTSASRQDSHKIFKKRNRNGSISRFRFIIQLPLMDGSERKSIVHDMIDGKYMKGHTQ